MPLSVSYTAWYTGFAEMVLRITWLFCLFVAILLIWISFVLTHQNAFYLSINSVLSHTFIISQRHNMFLFFHTDLSFSLSLDSHAGHRCPRVCILFTRVFDRLKKIIIIIKTTKKYTSRICKKKREKKNLQLVNNIWPVCTASMVSERWFASFTFFL